MLTIYSYAHSFRKRQTSKGIIVDVIFRVYENEIAHQKVLSGFSTKKLAENAYMEFVSTYCIYKNRVEEYKKNYVKFDEAANNYLKYSRSMVTAATTIKRTSFFALHYLPYFKNMNLENIKSNDIYKWFDITASKSKIKGSGTYAPKTLKLIWEEFYAFFSWCSDRYSIKNPMFGLKRPRTRALENNIRFWELDQFEKFIIVVDNPFWQTFFLFQYYTGCRIGETLALSEKDFKGDSIEITKSLSKKNLNGERYEIKSTKNCKSRLVPLPKILKSQLSSYLEWKRSHQISDRFLFNGSDGDYLPHSTIRRYFDYYTALSNNERIKIHDLRHSYVSLLIHKGANLAVIAGLIGDTLEQVTKTYGHLYESDKINVINLLN